MRKSLLLSLLLLTICLTVGCSHRNRQPGNSKIPLTDFTLQSSAVVHQNGKQLSSHSYHGKVYWFPVKVPSTILSGLVANHVYPDPHRGMNNMHIPDASDSANKVLNLSQYSYLPNQKNPWKKPYWYRTLFQLPDNYDRSRTWLHFNGINYRAAVWLNGHQLADSTDMAGMFRQYRFDVTSELNKKGKNYLAVKIYPLDDAGRPSHPQLTALGPFYPNGGPTGDIGKNVTMLASVGWDWMPAVRDRNMGIWQPVYLQGSGDVTIEEPHIITKLPDLPNTTHAALKLCMKLANNGNKVQNGHLRIDIKPKTFSGHAIHSNRKIKLAGGQTKIVRFDTTNTEQFLLKSPHLWWPTGYGKPNLYTLRMSYNYDGHSSDVKKVTFGIRTVDSRVTDVDGWPRRDFYINGQEIDLTGGAWVPDMMLQRDSLRYRQELSLIKNANLNTVRIWGGGIAPPDYFFDVADSLGLLVWQDFWITGDTNGGYKGSQKWPMQTDVFVKNIQSTIKQLRNHPSLFVWTGGNENHPRKELFDAMRNSVARLDSARPFISSSSGFAKLPEGWKKSWPDNTPTGVYSGGPYSWQPPKTYYKLVDQGKDWVWKDEVGLPSQPPYGSLKKIIPDLVPDTTQPYPLNDTWGYHDAAGGNGKYQTYYKAIKNRYGTPRSYKDYSAKAQLANANAYRAIFESVGSKIDSTGGVLLWKINAAWPSVIWQLYDWYLKPNAGYYFTKKAVEPLHIQFNPIDSSLALVNRSYKSHRHLQAQVSLYGRTMQLQARDTLSFYASVHQDSTIASLKEMLKELHGLTFLSLQLQYASNQIRSRNVYWLAPEDDFHALQKLPSSNIIVDAIDPGQSKHKYVIQLKNKSDKLAFFIHLKIGNASGDELSPSYWSDNYFSIAPHQSRRIRVNLQDAPVADKKLYLWISGQNVPRQHMQLSEN